MNNFESVALEKILANLAGNKAIYWLYERSVDNPMNYVIREAETRLSTTVSVYWVDGGPPRNFFLPGFTTNPIAYSSRYLEICAILRQLIVSDIVQGQRQELSERICLRLMAELSLHHGVADWTVPAFVKSIIGQSLHIPTLGAILEELELAPRNEAYMATWFFGLAHEIGHAFTLDGEMFELGLLSDPSIESALEDALAGFIHYPDELKAAALQQAKQDRDSGPLGTAHLRDEAMADIFAAQVLLSATANYMHEHGDEMDIEQFLAEMTIIFNIVVLIGSCRRTVLVASQAQSDRNARDVALFLPVAMHVRALLWTQYLIDLIAVRLTESEEQWHQVVGDVTEWIADINNSFADTLNDIESGLARAMRFVLFPVEREPNLLRKFAEEVSGRDGIMARIEGGWFCELASSLEIQDPLLQKLAAIVARQDGEMGEEMDEFVYVVPWVTGPNGFDRPFGLDTKYGHLVFVFLNQDDLYHAYFEGSAASLASGFTLTEVAVLANDTSQLSQELAKRMPSGLRFGVLVEGTDLFHRMIDELFDDRIWPDD